MIASVECRETLGAPMESSPDLAIELVWKRDLWALVSRLFAVEVDAVTWRMLSAPEATALGLAESAGSLGSDTEELEALRVEFCRLFIGPLPACPPFASVHLGEAILGGRARRVFEEFLVREDIDLQLFSGIASPDHIATQWATQAWLLDRSVADPTNPAPVAARRELLARHLLPWIPAFLGRVRAKAQLPFYRRLAEIAQELLAEEREVHGL